MAAKIHSFKTENDIRSFTVYNGPQQLNKIAQLKKLPEETRFAMKVVANILPFRVNEYVLEELIDWHNVPNDPIFQLVFPQQEMLKPVLFERMADCLKSNADKARIAQLSHEIRAELNPHPAGQMDKNVPLHKGNKLEGIQHKYQQTVLFFPSQAQICHSYCTFCFRWAQFVGDKSLRFASNEASLLQQYLAEHVEVTDLLLTGGDPMVMKTKHFERYVNILFSPELEHVQTLRIGSKALTFWPYRFVSDPDSGGLLDILEKLVKFGKHVTLMAHYNHWQELETPIAQEAIGRLKDVGVTIRAQGPLIGHINDKASVWSKLWRMQVQLGIIPYYMFVERDTGAQNYFAVPLAKAYAIYKEAIQSVSGLARTARGPSMSADPGKVEIQGISEIHGEKVFVLRFLQARNPDWVQQPFFAKYDAKATWLNDLKPAFSDTFFFE